MLRIVKTKKGKVKKYVHYFINFIFCMMLISIAGCRGVVNPEYPEELVRGEPLDAEGLRNKYPQLKGIVISAEEWWQEYEKGLEDIEYRIGAGMNIQIEVVEEPSLNRTIFIRPDGKVDLPLIGEVTAGGKTMYEFKAEIIRKLKKYVKDPHVIVNTVASQGITLGAPQVSGGKIAVLGPSGTGQHLDYTGQEKLSIILSANLSAIGEWRSVRVIRPNPKNPKKARIIICDAFKLAKFGDVVQDIPLRPGDIVIIPRRWLPGRQFERDWDLLLKFASGTISWDSIIKYWDTRIGK